MQSSVAPVAKRNRKSRDKQGNLVRWPDVVHEAMVLHKFGLISANPMDRLVCGRMRMNAQASVRASDSIRTRMARLKWLTNDDGSLRALVTQASETPELQRRHLPR